MTSPGDTDAAEDGDSSMGERSPINNGGSAWPVCLLRISSDLAAGATLGFTLGFGSGLMKKKGFRGSFAGARSSAKMFVVLSGVHSIVSCFLKRFSGKEDAISASISGCCTGLALSFPGPPQNLLQSCLSFGALSWILECLNKKQPSWAALEKSVGSSGIGWRSTREKTAAILPPFTLNLPPHIAQGFETFRDSLLQNKAQGP